MEDPKMSENEKLDLILKKLSSMDEDLKSVKQDVQDLKLGQDELNRVTSAILTSQEVSNAKLEAMELRLSNVEGGLKKLSGDVNNSFDYLAGKAGEHDKYIHLLRKDVDELRAAANE